MPRPIQDRIFNYGTKLYQNELEGNSEDKWNRLNSVLSKMEIDRVDLNYDRNRDIQSFVGPSENSILKSAYLLIQKV